MARPEQSLGMGCVDRQDMAIGEQQTVLLESGNPAIVELSSLRPVALRLRLSTNLPFSVDPSMQQKKLNLQATTP